MLKKIVLTLFLVLTSVAFGFAANGFTLVIDAGHGGHDTGAKGAYSLEKDINLKVALLFGQYVEQNCKDVNVIYTRKTDVFIPLKTRANIANRNNADLFISVHTNALPNGRIARGFEVYTLGMHRAKENLDVAMRENSVIEEEDNYKQTYQGFDPKSSESYIMFEFMQSANMRRSVDLAKMIEKSACSIADRNDMGVHQAGFLVLRETSMPSCLIELGFITTPDEEDFLNTDDGLDKLAQGIYKAFLKYKDKYSNKSAGKSNAVAPSNAIADSASAPTVSTKPVNNNDKDSSEQTSLTPARKAGTIAPDKPAAKVMAAKKNEPVSKVEPIKKVEKPKKAIQPTKEVAQTKAQTKAKPVETSKPKPVETKKPQPVVAKTQPVVPKKQQTTEEKKTVNTAKDKLVQGQPVFKVQVFAVSRKLQPNDPLLKGHKDFETSSEGSHTLIKYTIGSTNDYNAIVELKNNLRNDFPQAYIVAFKDGKPMNLYDAINEYKKYNRKHSHNRK